MEHYSHYSYSQLRLVFLYLTVILVLLGSCQNNPTTDDTDTAQTETDFNSQKQDSISENNLGSGRQKNMFLPHNRVLFDIDFDSIPDTLFVIAPNMNSNEEQIEDQCEGPCVTVLYFSQGFPELHIQESIGGEVVFLDDINENGFAELVFFPYWFHSCWSRIDIYSFNGTEWQWIKSLSYNACDESYPTEFEKLETGMLRVITNGEKVEESYSAHGDTILDFQGIERKIYDVSIPSI